MKLALALGLLALAAVLITVGSASNWLARQPPYAVLAWANRVIAPACTNGPFLSAAEAAEAFPQRALLEAPAAVAAMAAECAAALPSARAYGAIDPHQAATATRGTWRMYPLLYMHTPVAGARAACPRTAALLDAAIARGARIRNAFFSILEPHTALRPHVGIIQAVVRYHLGLLVPPDPRTATLHVGRETRHWRVGEGFLWDDMYEHAAVNDSDVPRAVLFLDIVRPDLTPWGAAADWVTTRAVRHNAAFRAAVAAAEPTPSTTLAPKPTPTPTPKPKPPTPTPTPTPPRDMDNTLC